MTSTTISIRNAKRTDQSQAAEVCFLASQVSGDERYKEIIHLRWSTPYFEEVSENCFVAYQPGKADQLIGYIICAPDSEAFEKICYTNWQPLLQQSLEKVWSQFSFFERIKLKFLYRFPKPNSFKKPKGLYAYYPAHLHINIHPDYQRLGLGSKLMDRLISHLQTHNIRGLHLWVDAANEKGVNFYKKYGFKEIYKLGIGTTGSICYGLSFQEKQT